MPTNGRPRRPEPATVEVLGEHISISDENGEIIYWDQEEWMSDPTIVPAIVNAVTIGLSDGGAELRRIIGNNSERRLCSLCEKPVALAHRRAHLITHNANAADMTAEEVISMFTERKAP